MSTTRPRPLAPASFSPRHALPSGASCWRTRGGLGGLALALGAFLAAPSQAADEAPAKPVSAAASARKPAASASAPSMGEQVRAAIADGAPANKRLTLVINGKEKKYITLPAPEPKVPAATPAQEKASQPPARAARSNKDSPPSAAVAAPAAVKHAPAPVNPQASRQYIRAKAAALTGHPIPLAMGETAHEGPAHWAYEGTNGPQAWGKLGPDFNLCATGKRQSPIDIDESGTLQGPAEALQFNYRPSSGSVVNNGHTIQVDVLGDNTLTVRGTSYKLVQFHFHHPAEERVNARGFAMVAHLVHQSAEGQLAVLAVLLDPGIANALVNKVWTYMPLDTGDRVPVPGGLLDLNELLPRDQRYYQFMGSLTTPPCTEGVLWLVLKQPSAVSREQIRLFSQVFPNNARPVQPLNGRAVRDAQ
jgi:carbonic anhydrase